ncbi:MAG: pilus assembly protein HicB [Gammaproteobacteria bacterium]|nr:pilus assembly protein HicB [Gammaproteobacteria bacterium]MXY89120.1 pilus assembly protein HicB [Gammaproteobacteria bacterium]MYE29575.1 pilus assembly protein HicB [Gammaproteobacteria bacterium]MYE98817.1 pilus assembly protein HicB [Gammaproteobacteria bacterium]MYG97094.1 pilus assembly protein HicB [Gammaproteobacteria bacterium]
MSGTTRAKYPLKLPVSLKDKAARLAKDDGVSLNQWIAVAVAQKIGAVETAAEFFVRRGAGSARGDLKRHLDNAPDAPPQPGDELPDV